jgi:hypothetical protein
MSTYGSYLSEYPVPSETNLELLDHPGARVSYTIHRRAWPAETSNRPASWLCCQLIDKLNKRSTIMHGQTQI